MAKIEQGGRGVSVDDVNAISCALGVMPAVLLAPFDCPQCHGNPPGGFICQLCGAPETASDNGQAMRALDALERAGRNLTDDFLSQLAKAYMELVAANENPAPAIAVQTDAPVRTVHRWIAVARKRNYLPPTTQGRAG
jgi:hypothetical protein